MPARRVAALVLAAQGLVLGAGCGATSERAQVDRYVEAANTAQQRADPVFRQVNTTYARFAAGTLQGPEAELELRRSEIDLAGVRTRVAAIPVPPAAHELRRLLLRTYDASVLLASESREMASYVPRATQELAALERVRIRLGRRLRRTRSAPQQAAALRDYAAALGRTRARLLALEVPPVLAPTADAQVRRLAGARSLADRLRGAIERRDAARVAGLLKAFRAAGASSRAQAALSRGAIAAYEQRVAYVSRAAAAARNERVRLGRL